MFGFLTVYPLGLVLSFAVALFFPWKPERSVTAISFLSSTVTAGWGVIMVLPYVIEAPDQLGMIIWAAVLTWMFGVAGGFIGAVVRLKKSGR